MPDSTSTALAVRDADDRSRGVSVADQATAGMTFDDLFRLGEELVPTGFLPRHIRTPAQAVAIILTGRELGMPPMRALRSLMMVEGKVVENADSQLARFKSDGGRAQFRRLDESGATLWLRHPNGDEHEESFTIEDAQAAGLANKDNWRKYRKAMLRSRVITAGLKSVGWEGGAGAYDPDEAVDFTPPPPPSGDRPNGTTRPQAVPSSQPAAESKPMGERPMATPAQIEKLRALVEAPHVSQERREAIDLAIAGGTLTAAKAGATIRKLEEEAAAAAAPASSEEDDATPADDERAALIERVRELAQHPSQSDADRRFLLARLDEEPSVAQLKTWITTLEQATGELPLGEPGKRRARPGAAGAAMDAEHRKTA